MTPQQQHGEQQGLTEGFRPCTCTGFCGAGATLLEMLFTSLWTSVKIWFSFSTFSCFTTFIWKDNTYTRDVAFLHTLHNNTLCTTTHSAQQHTAAQRGSTAPARKYRRRRILCSANSAIQYCCYSVFIHQPCFPIPILPYHLVYQKNI